jgi:hypothetical protein
MKGYYLIIAFFGITFFHPRIEKSSTNNKSGYWMKMLFIIIAILATSPAFAQILIEGTIKDKDTKEGLPFAHVYVEGTSTVAVADIDGVFVISVPLEQAEKKLVISTMGYNNFEKTPAEIQAKKIKEFLLKSAVFNLDLAVVRSPEKVLKDALSKVKENYWSESFMVEGFYRKGALENNKFTYLTEAIIQYYNRGYHKTDKYSLDINILELRNSEDFRQVKMIQHWNPIFNAMYNFDKVKTEAIHGLLKKTKMGSATMEMSVYNGEDIYIIKLSRFIIYVGFDNDKIYRIDTKGGENGTGSSFQYRAYKGKLYPFYFRIKRFVKDGKRVGSHMITDYKGRDIRGEAALEAESVIEEETRDRPLPLNKKLRRIDKQTKIILVKKSKEILRETDMDKIGFIQEFIATDITIKSEERYKKRSNMDIHRDLFETKIFYDIDFWNSFQLPDKSKFLQKIKADLEEAGNGKTLEEQFEETGKKNNDENPRLRKRKKK